MSKTSAGSYRAFPRQYSLVCAVALLIFFPLFVCAQNPPSPTPSDPPVTAAPAPAADASHKPASPSKPKHVITNEDLEPHSSGSAHAKGGEFVPGESPLLSCDASCEQTARNELGYDSDNEAEWRAQVVPARRELLEDTVWRGMLSQAIQQTHYYCNFLLQQMQQTASSGNDYNSRAQRARDNNYFENMGRTLRQGIEATMNRMEQHTNEVRVLSPVRAAMMSAQAARILNRTCELPAQR